MQIQINTDNHVNGHERMETYFTEIIEKSLKRFEGYIITQINIMIINSMYS